jgi:hypothetical protein
MTEPDDHRTPPETPWLDGLPVAFRSACMDQAIVTPGQALSFCDHLRQTPSARLALGLVEADLDVACGLLSGPESQASTLAIDYSNIPFGVPLADPDIVDEEIESAAERAAFAGDDAIELPEEDGGRDVS